jgi:geranylgeranyl pyrophosphate synthase
LKFGSVLEEIMRYAYESADPLCASLALWTCEACGGDAEGALPVAASIECLHRFAVLHDELDDGSADAGSRASTSAKWGLAQTLNAGDAYHAVALRLLSADAPHPDRALAAGVMLTQTVLHRSEQRSRFAAIHHAGGNPQRAHLRSAADSTWSLMLATSMRAGAICAAAPAALSATLARAGRFLGITVELGSQAERRSQELARRYAAKASSEVEYAGLGRTYTHDFGEIAHHFTTISSRNGDRV